MNTARGNERELTCGTDFRLFKSVGGDWTLVPFVDTAFTSIALRLENGSSTNYTLQPYMLSEKLGEGDYRIVTNVRYGAEPDEAMDVYAEFRIDGDAPPQEVVTFPEGFFGRFDGRNMTLDDVRALAQKGDKLILEDLSQFNCVNFSSSTDRVIMHYPIDENYRLEVRGNLSGKPERVTLTRVPSGGGIDIRYEDVELFLGAGG
jgi:hypothetical protein